MTTAPVAPPPDVDAGRSRSGGNPMTKLTVNITPRAAAALDGAADTNSETKTNVVNRAIQAYAFLTQMMAEGWELVLRDPNSDREQRIQFL